MQRVSDCIRIDTVLTTCIRSFDLHVQNKHQCLAPAGFILCVRSATAFWCRCFKAFDRTSLFFCSRLNAPGLKWVWCIVIIAEMLYLIKYIKKYDYWQIPIITDLFDRVIKFFFFPSLCVTHKHVCDHFATESLCQEACFTSDHYICGQTANKQEREAGTLCFVFSFSIGHVSTLVKQVKYFTLSEVIANVLRCENNQPSV